MTAQCTKIPEESKSMDRHFLEFWGKYLTNAAEGQKQLEDMATWMGQGLRGFEYLTTLFQKTYGLDRLPEDSPEYMKTWKKAEQDFRRSFKDYLSFFGVVLREDHQALARQYEELKQTVAAQEETITHLRLLLSQKIMDQGDAFNGFQDVAKEQAAQFQELMNSLSKAFKVGKASKDSKTTTKEGSSSPPAPKKIKSDMD
jgi:hypothetical protein